MSYTHRAELSTILAKLPLRFYDDGPINAIRAAYANGYANRLWSREQAVRVLFLANMQRATHTGNGNKAKRRAGIHIVGDLIQMARP